MNIFNKLIITYLMVQVDNLEQLYLLINGYNWAEVIVHKPLTPDCI
jgi:hypothetical protein